MKTRLEDRFTDFVATQSQLGQPPTVRQLARRYRIPQRKVIILAEDLSFNIVQSGLTLGNWTIKDFIYYNQ